MICFSRNASSHTLQRLQMLARDNSVKIEELEDPDGSTSLDLLLRFQRLLMSRLYPLGQGQVTNNQWPTISSDPGKVQ